MKPWMEKFTRGTAAPPWAATLVVLSSAALGGIAVALWNRKALSAFRELEAGREMPDMPQNDGFVLEDENTFY